MQRGHEMNGAKFVMLSLRALVTLFEGLMESGPQLILQIILILHGIHNHELSLLFSSDPDVRLTLTFHL